MCSSVSYLVEEINYFLRAKSLAKSGDEKISTLIKMI